MKTFLQTIKKDPEYYRLFLTEAESVGAIDKGKRAKSTLEYARKDYSESFIEKSNKRLDERGGGTKLQDYILIEDKQMDRDEKFKRHI